jgi:membrane-associated phospholipid phosphatase
MIRLFARAASARRNEQDEQGSTQPPLESDAKSAVTDNRSTITPAPVFSLATAAFVSAAAALTFAGLTVWIVRRGSSVPQVDHYLHHWAISQRSPGSIPTARAVTWGGVTTVVLPALIVVGAVTARAGRDLTRRVNSGLLLVGIAGAGVYTETRINALVGRSRPPLADWAGVAGGPSFPSGHTSAATLFAALSAWALAARVRPGWPRRAVWAGAAIYATAVAWSRIWLGVHWPTGVIGSWLYGLAWFAGSIALIVTLQRRRAGHRAPWSGGTRPGGQSPPRRWSRVDGAAPPPHAAAPATQCPWKLASGQAGQASRRAGQDEIQQAKGRGRSSPTAAVDADASLQFGGRSAFWHPTGLWCLAWSGPLGKAREWDLGSRRAHSRLGGGRPERHVPPPASPPRT